MGKSLINDLFSSEANCGQWRCSWNCRALCFASDRKARGLWHCNSSAFRSCGRNKHRFVYIFIFILRKCLTRQGGIVALGVFHQRWSTNDAINRFRALARRAFTLRLGLGNSFIKAIAQPWYEFLYTSEGIEQSLQESFGGSNLFGASLNHRNSAGGRDWVKVGVVSCLQGGNQAKLIANYSRNPKAGTDEGKHRETASGSD